MHDLRFECRHTLGQLLEDLNPPIHHIDHLDFFQQLNSIPEWIQDVHAIESCQRFISDRWKPGGSASGLEFCQAAHQDCRVRFAGCVEVTVYTEMQAQAAASEPHTTPCGKIRRLGLFD